VAHKFDLARSCWDYLHSNLNESLKSGDPFVSSLAVINAKVGRQRLRRTAMLELHPLTRAMLEFRLEAENQLQHTSRKAKTKSGPALADPDF
jgi:hypothetical protein